MVLRCAMMMFVLTSAVSADTIVSSGLPFGYLAPHPPYAPGELVLQVTLGYGDPSNTIGGGLWHTGPGVYNLANDPGLAGFIEHASDGLVDTLIVTVADSRGYQNAYALYDPEAMLFGRNRNSYVDLAPLQVTGVLLDVVDVERADGSGTVFDGIYVRYDFVGVPEPETLLLVTASLGMTCIRRNNL